MKANLFARGMARFLGGVLLMALLLFPAAGTLAWPEAWLLMGLLFVPMFAAGLVMLARRPALLEKRLSASEREDAQKRVIGSS